MEEMEEAVEPGPPAWAKAFKPAFIPFTTVHANSRIASCAALSCSDVGAEKTASLSEQSFWNLEKAACWFEDKA